MIITQNICFTLSGTRRKVNRFFYVCFVLLLLIPVFNNCKTELPPVKDHFRLDLEDQQKRVVYTQEELEFESFGRLKLSAGSYAFTVVANIGPPSVAGVPVQACFVHSYDSKIYVAYNLAGNEYKGGVDIFTYSLDPVNTTLTSLYSLGFSNSDINSVATIYTGADSYEVFLVGSTIGYSGSGLSSPAFLIYFDPTLTSYEVFDIPGYTANSVGYNQGSSWFAVSSGSNGGLTIIDRASMTSVDYLAITNLTSVFTSGDYAYHVSSDNPSRLRKYQNSTSTSQVFTLSGYSSDPVKKSSVDVRYGHSFVALNDGGTVIFNNTTNSVVGSLTPSDPGGVPAEYLKSNGLCVSDYRLFIANGGGGLSLAELDVDMNTNLVGNVTTDQSVNHVALLEENGNSGYLALVSGKAGLKIVYYRPTFSTTVPRSITESSAESGGNIADDGGTAVISRGVCWSTSSNPTIADNKTNNGSGTGSFTSSITGLSANTTYYLRAYASNNVSTDYGDQVVLISADGSFTDSRDSKTYGYVTIGTQTWMIDNLAYLPSVNTSAESSESVPYYYVYGYEGTVVSTARDHENYNTYGALYNWAAAETACPDGWKLPSDDEWKVLEVFLGMSVSDADDSSVRYTGNVGEKLKSISGWYDKGNGSNSSRFNTLPGGYRLQGGGFYSLRSNARFWTSLGIGSTSAWRRYLNYGSDGVGRLIVSRKFGFSVRCIQN